MTVTASTTGPLRRGLFAAFAGCAIGGAAVVGPASPSAVAAPDPCAASQIAKTIGSVANSTGSYLDAHPETNQALTTISQQPAGPQSLAAAKTYFDANPKAGKDMQRLQSPLVKLSTQCELPVSLPQLLGLMQAAQTQADAVTGGLPADVPSAQSVGVQGAPAATPSPVTTAPKMATQSTGPLPGPSGSGAS